MIDLNHTRNLAVRPRAGFFVAVLMLGVLLAASGPAQTFTTLHSFTATSGAATNSDGANPRAGLTISGNTLYGTANGGGSSGFGTVFAVNTNGTGFTNLHSFTGPYNVGSDGANPLAGLIISGNTLYGTASEGGSSDYGTVFAVNTNGTGFSVMHNFTGSGSDGADPFAGLILSGNTLYGTAIGGGNSGGLGTVFAIDTDGTGFAILHSFTSTPSKFPTNSDGVTPFAGLILSGNTLYGTAGAGGYWGYGTVFKLNTDGTGFTTLYSFSATSTNSSGSNTNSGGANPQAGLILSGNTLYGTAPFGGSSGFGTVFAVNTDGTGFRTLHNFSGIGDGAGPWAGLILSGNTLYGTAIAGGSSGKGTVFAINTDGTAFTTLHNFSGSDGSALYAGLILSGNTLYGTTSGGGSSASGTAFKLNTDGTGFTTLHNFTAAVSTSPFSNSDGATPEAGLVLSGNTLYGTAERGGGSANGTVFAVNTDGTGFTTLHNFTALAPYPNHTNSDGAKPYAGLLLSGSTLYGTATEGGSAALGTVFAVNTDGTGFTNLHSFTDTHNNSSGGYTNSDGAVPHAGLILSGNTLYGTATEGGSAAHGTVFAVNNNGSGFTNLHNFSGSDGASPWAGLVLSGNTLYGTAPGGGSAGNGTVFALKTDGTGFTVLHTFFLTGLSDGVSPLAGLVLSGNTLYGTAAGGGSSGYGTVFAVNTDGTGYTNLHSFTGISYNTNSDGAGPDGGVILSGNTLFGTAYHGGSFGSGTVFSLSLGSVSAPQLTTILAGGSIILRWPTNAAGFTLQSTTNLVSPAVWTTNSPAPVIVNGQYTLTNLISGKRKFFRLIR